MKDFSLENKTAVEVKISFMDGTRLELSGEDAKWVYNIAIRWNRAMLKLLANSRGRLVEGELSTPLAILDLEND